MSHSAAYDVDVVTGDAQRLKKLCASPGRTRSIESVLSQLDEPNARDDARSQRYW